jgi:phosphate transport system protein
MPIHLHRDLENLQRKILAMAANVEETVEKAIRALYDRDMALAAALTEGDQEIDREENEIEEDCLKILALHQPVAMDLRRVAASLKINTDLERMGDLAVNIAERAYSYARLAHQVPIPPALRNMADLTTTMVRQSLDSFVRLDSALARRICRLDDEVDRHNREIALHLIRLMKESPDNVESGLDLFSVVRQLERIADHATNIAEDVVYLVEGEIVRHHPELLREGAGG